MIALSLHQPYASAVACGIKQFETRGWPMPQSKIGSVLAIHAALRNTPETRANWRTLKNDVNYNEIGSRFSRFGFDDWEELPRGAMLGFVRVIACYKTEDAVQQGMISRAESVLGGYASGRYCTKLRAFYLFEKPIPAIGRQGFFNWKIPADTLGHLTQKVCNSDVAYLAKMIASE